MMYFYFTYPKEKYEKKTTHREYPYGPTDPNDLASQELGSAALKGADMCRIATILS